MIGNMKRLLLLMLACMAILVMAMGQTKTAPQQPVKAAAGAPAQTTKPAAPDLTKQPTLYVVGYAHLDTQWRWDYATTIKDYLPKTMRLNFDWFEKYPHYVFNFSGANRYRMIKEYYPADYQLI